MASRICPGYKLSCMGLATSASLACLPYVCGPMSCTLLHLGKLESTLYREEGPPAPRQHPKLTASKFCSPTVLGSNVDNAFSSGAVQSRPGPRGEQEVTSVPGGVVRKDLGSDRMLLESRSCRPLRALQNWPPAGHRVEQICSNT